MERPPISSKPGVAFLSHAVRVSRVFLSTAKELTESGTRLVPMFVDQRAFPNLRSEKHVNVFEGLDCEELDLFDWAKPIYGEKTWDWHLFGMIIRKAFEDFNIEILAVSYDFPGWNQVAVRIAKEMGLKALVLQETVNDPWILWNDPFCKTVQYAPFGSLRRLEKSDTGSRLDFTQFLSNQPNAVTKFVRGMGKKLFSFVGNLRRRPDTDQIETITPDYTKGFGFSGADIIAVMGEYYKGLLIELGLNADKISTVGYARGDYMGSQPEESLNLLEGFASNRPICVLVSQHFVQMPIRLRHDPYGELVRARDCLEELSEEMQFLVLAHPDDDFEDLQSRFEVEEHESTIVRRGDGDYSAVFDRCQLIVGMWSTCLIESMRIGRPIVTLDYVAHDSVLPQLIELGAVFPVLRKWDLKMQMRNALYDQNRVEFSLRCQKNLYKLLMGPADGRAGQRVAHMICGLLGEVKESREGRQGYELNVIEPQ